jgi:hypothetical protein
LSVAWIPQSSIRPWPVPITPSHAGFQTWLRRSASDFSLGVRQSNPSVNVNINVFNHGVGNGASCRSDESAYGNGDSVQRHEPGRHHAATWSSSNSAVATVTTGGLLTVLQLGTAVITATYQSVSGRFSLSLGGANVRLFGRTVNELRLDCFRNISGQVIQ